MKEELEILQREYDEFVNRFMREAPFEMYWEYRTEYKRERTRLASNIRNVRLRIARSKATHTKKEWKEFCDRTGNICVACKASTKLTKDHIVPIIDGGTDGIENLQPLCSPCNSIKSASSTNYLKLASK